MRRVSSKRLARIRAELEAPLPPVAETLAVLDQLATHGYETKARWRAAVKLAHRTLHDLLRRIEFAAQHEELIARVTADSLHRELRQRLELDKPKRFPSLPRPYMPPPAPLPREFAAADRCVPASALSPDRAAQLFADDGVEFDPEAG